jgi:hypothetical protein
MSNVRKPLGGITLPRMATMGHSCSFDQQISRSADQQISRSADQRDRDGQDESCFVEK